MKNLLLLSILIFGLGQMNAQVIIEKSDFTLEIGSAIYRTHVDPASAPIPTEGIDQVWDYTSLVVLDSDTIALETFMGAEFPTANASRDEISLQSVGPLQVPFERTNYYTLNENEYGRVGVKFQPLDIPTGALTGSPTDSINYLESNGFYPGNPDYVAWFPMNYGDTRNSNYVVNNEFLLTVGAFGVDHVPCLNEVVGNVENEVVGWGNLSLINPTDQSTVVLEVLAMKTTHVETDSFFIGGAPFPQALLDAFAVAQGQPSTSVNYTFFAKGFSSPVLTISQGGGESWMPSDLTVITALQEVGDHAIPFQYYPNPASDQLNIQFEKSTNEPWMFSLYNSIGQKVDDHLVDQPMGTVNKSIEFSKRFHAGNYFYVLYNEDKSVMSSGKININ